MDVLVYRLVLAAVALGPAAVLAAVPTSTAFLPLGIVIGGAGGLFALVSSFRREKPRRRGPALLRRAALRRPGSDLPTLDNQRLAIANALGAAVDLRAEPDAPPTRDTAVGRILSRILDSWNVTDIAALPRDLTLALTLLKQCLNAPPGEAGRIAQMFQRPDVVLGLRQEIDTIAKARATYDQALAAFLATQEIQATGTAPRTLTQALRAMSAPDIDLWHHIVTQHDPTDPAQRDAALWCAAQPECDHASVAVYLSRLADGAQLQNVYIDADSTFLDQVRGIFANCNAGIYRHRGLVYVPPADATIRLKAELDALASLSDKARWPDPQCVFTVLEGRKPHPRPAWDLSSGRLVAAPNRSDYL
ncbi:hypothetical protein [Antarctobacter heliothermus]|uniref:Uncharacterized protein n=1 Tax=Antarctobacter heliothermus TaxID=74033 RepID=A0A239CEA2_9RHOB|nr:hypothetical protein [Antarctobacter heliothermus]SNS18279.1 hypothetical protein SAMN04488078_100690 [Antarctobacter heliothermus]